MSHYEVSAIGRQAQGACSEWRKRGVNGDLRAANGPPYRRLPSRAKSFQEMEMRSDGNCRSPRDGERSSQAGMTCDASDIMLLPGQLIM
jgi:hypothetical protein